MTLDQFWTRRTRARHPRTPPSGSRPASPRCEPRWLVSARGSRWSSRQRSNPRSFRADSGKDSGRPWSLVGSRHNGRGSGRRANLHPCQPPVRPHSPRPMPGVSPAACAMRWRSPNARGCATDVAAAIPKMRAAPQKRSAPGTHRPSLLRHPGGTALEPDNRRPVPRPGMRVVSAAERQLTVAGPVRR